jgi:Spy/CpxP family protein refolding chaperone
MNRWVAFVSIAALFVSGIAIGALGMHVFDVRQGPPHPSGPPPHHGAAIDDLQRELDLSADQREKITAILEESWRAGEEIRREMKPRLDQHIADTEQRLMEVLTPAQRERFDTLRRERRVRAEHIFLGPPGPPGPHEPLGPPGGPDSPGPSPGSQEEPSPAVP